MISANAQKDKEVGVRIERLETNIKKLEDEAKIGIGAEDNKITGLKNELGALDNKIGALQNDQDWYLKALTWFGIPAGLIALIAGFYQVFVRTKKLIEDKIANIVEENKSKILQLITSQDLENTLKEESEISVLSDSENDQNNIKGIISNFHFKSRNISYRILKKEETLSFDYDLMVFNQIDKEVINKYIADSADKDLFVAYTFKQIDRHQRLNFSNSPMTLYTNIMNTLKYKKLLNA